MDASLDKLKLKGIDPIFLTKNGFYYDACHDIVICVYCGMKFHNPSDIYNVHRRIGTKCIKIRPNSVPENWNLNSYNGRLETFKNWPKGLNPKKEDLADAGFYYTNIGDQTICWYCKGGVKDWEPNDNPWEQHIRWFPNCGYVVSKKSQDYIDYVLKKF